jgi:hypothetical protein
MSLLAVLRARVLGEPMPLPPEFSGADLPAGVRVVRGGLIPRLGGFFAGMGTAASAVTLGSTIVVHPRARLTTSLLTHELEHVRQWREDRLFPLRYTLATLRHGYHDNPYEVAARSAALASTRPSSTEDLS